MCRPRNMCHVRLPSVRPARSHALVPQRKRPGRLMCRFGQRPYVCLALARVRRTLKPTRRSWWLYRLLSFQFRAHSQPENIKNVATAWLGAPVRSPYSCRRGVAGEDEMRPYFVLPPFMTTLVTCLLRESHQEAAQPLPNISQLSSRQRWWSLSARRRHAPLYSCCRHCTDTSANIKNSRRTACVPAAAVRHSILSSPQHPKPSIPVGDKRVSGVRAASPGNAFDNGSPPHGVGSEKSRARVPRSSRAELESVWYTLLDGVLSSEHCERGCSTRQPRNMNGAAVMADGYRQPFRWAPRLKSVCIL